MKEKRDLMNYYVQRKILQSCLVSVRSILQQLSSEWSSESRNLQFFMHSRENRRHPEEVQLMVDKLDTATNMINTLYETVHSSMDRNSMLQRTAAIIDEKEWTTVSFFQRKDATHIFRV